MFGKFKSHFQFTINKFHKQKFHRIPEHYGTKHAMNGFFLYLKNSLCIQQSTFSILNVIKFLGV